MMFQDYGTVPRRLPGPVVVRFDHDYACSLVDQIRFGMVYVEPNAHVVCPRRKREIRNVANEHLRSNPLANRPFGLEQAVRREDTLPYHAVESQTHIKTARGVRQVEEYFDLQPHADPNAFHHWQIVVCV